jgi:hypothetical protein
LNGPDVADRTTPEVAFSSQLFRARLWRHRPEETPEYRWRI